MKVTVSTDKTRLDAELIHAFLMRSYWAEGRSLETVAASIQGSLCFGVYEGEGQDSDRGGGEEQVGFARVVTDYATFAYLADVFILESHRGRGLGKLLLEAMLRYPAVQGCNWALFTLDAHALYEHFGFERPAEPERLMRRKSVSALPLKDVL